MNSYVIVSSSGSKTRVGYTDDTGSTDAILKGSRRIGAAYGRGALMLHQNHSSISGPNSRYTITRAKSGDVIGSIDVYDSALDERLSATPEPEKPRGGGMDRC